MKKFLLLTILILPFNTYCQSNWTDFGKSDNAEHTAKGNVSIKLGSNVMIPFNNQIEWGSGTDWYSELSTKLGFNSTVLYNLPFGKQNRYIFSSSLTYRLINYKFKLSQPGIGSTDWSKREDQNIDITLSSGYIFNNKTTLKFGTSIETLIKQKTEYGNTNLSDNNGNTNLSIIFSVEHKIYQNIFLFSDLRIPFYYYTDLESNIYTDDIIEYQEKFLFQIKRSLNIGVGVDF